MRKVFLIAVLIFSLFLVGCAATRNLGTIDGVDLYAVETNDSLAPNTTTIIANVKGTQTLEVVNKATGPSNVGQIIAPVAGVGNTVIQGEAMKRAAKNLRPDNTNIDVEGSKASASGGDAISVAKGGKAVSGSSSSSNAWSNSSSSSSSSSYQHQGQYQSQSQKKGHGK